MTDYDESYTQFLQAIDGQPNLTLDTHRLALLKWLNSWGCRQFAIKYHDLASEEIRAWHEQYGELLPSLDTTFLALSGNDINNVAVAYTDLSERLASKRKQPRGGEHIVKFGPTGAAKLLFALRPQALVPWDEAFRQELQLDGSAHSYLTYFRIVKEILEELAEDCRRNGYNLSDLPELVGRPTSSLAKLIDEYFWVTISKKCKVPPYDTLIRWVNWK